jgi:hypothetical protein
MPDLARAGDYKTRCIFILLFLLTAAVVDAAS